VLAQLLSAPVGFTVIVVGQLDETTTNGGVTEQYQRIIAPLAYTLPAYSIAAANSGHAVSAPRGLPTAQSIDGCDDLTSTLIQMAQR
jgi:hypothetical protein